MYEVSLRLRSDVALAARIAAAAIVASASIDPERSRLYLDLLLISLSKSAPQVLKAAMNTLGYEYQSDFARRYVAQGKTEGRVEIVLKQLALRFAPLTDAVQDRVRNAQDAEVVAVAERVLTAQTLDEALAPLT